MRGFSGFIVMTEVQKVQPAFRSERIVPRRRARIGWYPGADYQIIQAQAVLSLLFGVLSILCFLTVYVFWIPLAGLGFGWVARKEIAKAPKERLGLGMAKTGMLLSLVFGITGCTWVMYWFLAAAPPGYKLITFAELQPNPDEPKLIPQFARDLEGKKVFIWGYMIPGEKQYGITDFVMVGQVSHCQFCQAQLLPTQMIEVHLTHGIKLDYTTKKIGVGGVFTCSPDALKQQFGGIVYRIEADVVR